MLLPSPPSEQEVGEHTGGEQENDWDQYTGNQSGVRGGGLRQAMRQIIRRRTLRNGRSTHRFARHGCALDVERRARPSRSRHRGVVYWEVSGEGFAVNTTTAAGVGVRQEGGG